MSTINTILILTILGTCFSRCHESALVRKVVVDSKSNFGFLNDGRVFIEDTVRSGVIRGNDDIGRILYTKSEFIGDTLLINIFGFNEVFVHRYQIKVFNGLCMADYEFEMDVDDASREVHRKITPVDFLVVLNSLDFKNEKEIRGHTEFKAKCIGDDCHGNTDIEIKGNFKVRLR